MVIYKNKKINTLISAKNNNFFQDQGQLYTNICEWEPMNLFLLLGAFYGVLGTLTMQKCMAHRTIQSFEWP